LKIITVRVDSSFQRSGAYRRRHRARPSRRLRGCRSTEAECVASSLSSTITMRGVNAGIGAVTCARDGLLTAIEALAPRAHTRSITFPSR
jgi:hypothetical protein